MKLTDLYFELRGDIGYVEKGIAEAVQCDVAELESSSQHLLQAGGKRLRPALALLCGRFGQPKNDALYRLAISLELIHMATLVHDDVIDDSDTRRGQPTVKAKWDNRVAMYTGDFILAKALEQVTTLSNPKIHQQFSRALVEMSIGEIEQLRDLHSWDQTFRNYLRRIKRKTALLIAVSCQLGALSSEVGMKDAHHLYRYGYNLGMAFQITDDILDYTGDAKKMGKPAGSDLLQGNITLPALYTYNHPEHGEKLRQMLEERDGIADEEIIQYITNHGGIQFSREITMKYLNKSRKALEQLPAIRTRNTLYNITQFIEKRNF